MHMGTIAHSLLRYASGFQSSRYGIALEDFALMPGSVALGATVAQSLTSEDASDRRIGIFFCHGFWRSGRISQLGNRLAQHLPAELVRLVSDSDDLARSAAHELLVEVRDSVPGYRDIMLRALVDTYAQARTVALNSIGTFLKPGEIEPLMTFVHDAYMAEIAPGGPIHYVLRNQALTAIERIAGREFDKPEVTAMIEGEIVFWRDWRPMLRWYHSGAHPKS
jgi:hypothetical protein